MKIILSAVACSVAIAIAPLAWGQSLNPSKPEDVGFSSERLARIAPVFQHEVDEGHIPGAIIMIARKGRLAYAETVGFRDKPAGSPMQKDAIFRIYSMTKLLTSVAAMILMEEGHLQLTDPISKYLPEFANVQVSEARLDPSGKATYALVPEQRPPTVHDLLRHTAGLAYANITGNALVVEAYTKAELAETESFRSLTPAEQVERLAKAPLIHQPGTVWEYSVAVDMLGRVVEKVSGMRLSDFLQQRLFGPLGMIDTAFWVPEAKMARLAQPLAVDPTTRLPR